MKNLKTYEDFLGDNPINEALTFNKSSLVKKLEEKLVYAEKAIEMWGNPVYEEIKERIIDAIKLGKVDTKSRIGNIQPGNKDKDPDIFKSGNAVALANALAKIIKKYKKYEVESTSVKAAAGWSGTARSTKSGFIKGTVNTRYGSGTFLIGVVIGGAVDINIKQKIMDEVYPLLYTLDDYNSSDGGVNVRISEGTNYSTIGLFTTRNTVFSDSFDKKLSNILN